MKNNKDRLSLQLNLVTLYKHFFELLDRFKTNIKHKYENHILRS